MSQQLLDEPKLELDPIDIVRDILAQAETLPRLMEIHYLVQEPGMLDVVRCMAALPDDDRARLQSFLKAQGTPSLLRVREAGPGVLRIECENVPLQKTA